ncbi:hypothetical protein HID58_027909 [Brassica napus]|uniref:Protein FAR1-RELATED SEQUENCE n=1 Tax=Brassica napus TaxID=3708 RepID=A0ABQ8CT55_BRANA|nr:hypothetical protein HID58_027909 [Brassica napus]
MEFETHEDAYTYYKDYAKSAGFGTAKLSSRRSRASKEFIDAKFSCIRYGTKQQSDDAINPRASPKIGCKASMHVKRRPDGKWYVYSFVEEHNHDLLPEQSHFFRSHRIESSDPRLRRNKKSNNPLADCSKHLAVYHDLAFPRNLDYWGMWQDAFLKKFFKCVYGSWSEEEFDRRWMKLIDKFHLRDVQWMRCLYDERSFWAPTFMRGVTFAGMSTRYRSESVNSMFDRYVQCETSLKDFLEGYGMMLEDRYEEEAKADFDAWHEAPELKSPSPFEKQVLLVYTHVVFRRFQLEVLGAAACHLTKESEGGTTYSVKDFEDDQKYLVEWDESKSDIYCSCRSFEYKGYLCRHAIVVLQMSGVFTIPINYVLQRWTNAARNRHQISGNLELVQCNIRRFNDLCRRAIILGEEGSLSQESYDVAMFAMKEAFKLCAIKVNTIEHPTIDHIHEDNQYGSTSKQIGLEHNIQHAGNASGQGETIKEKRSSLNNTSKKAKVVHVTESGNVGEGSQEGFQHVVAASRPFQAGLAAQFHNTIPAVFQNVIPTEFHNIQATNMHQNNPPG